MKHVYPAYYQKFKCVANLCPDSCCKDWDVVVDEKTEAFYRTVKGELGDKIRCLTVTDGDGDRIFVPQSGKCPFWNSDMLCDIYIGLGEEHLCETCANFPRLTLDYTDFCEHMLSFACPEAARLMLEEENAYTDFGADYDLATCDYDLDGMRFLLQARAETAALFSDKSKPFSERLRACLAFNAQVQNILDGGEPAVLPEASGTDGCGFIFALHGRLDIMDENWKKLIAQAGDRCDSLPVSQENDDAFEKLALYYLYRYYLGAIDTGDVLSTVKRIVCAYVVIGKLCAGIEKGGAKPALLKIMQRYSKEVEHSYENGEELEFEFAVNPRFSAASLMAVLRNLR